jgi:hypothetical protein
MRKLILALTNSLVLSLALGGVVAFAANAACLKSLTPSIRSRRSHVFPADAVNGVYIGECWRDGRYAKFRMTKG